MSRSSPVLETRKITKQEAERCASERIQFIGAVQPHGFVLVVDSSTLDIVQYSANITDLLSSEGKDLESTSFLNSSLLDLVKCDSQNPFASLTINVMQIFQFGKEGVISSKDWECLGVINGNYVTLEFFPVSSKYDSFELMMNLDRMVNRIKNSENTEELFRILTEEFQKHTDYDRVMLYRFLPDWSGEVIAESVSNNTEVKFLNMRFPAEDIPKQARELYKKSSLRIMADVNAEPAQLVPTLLPNNQPLDQSNSVLRAMSSMHIAYLKNMGIRASMSIALMTHGKLWGLVAFHHYSPKVPPNHLVSEMKASCELFTDIVVSHLQPTMSLENIERNASRKREMERVFQASQKLTTEQDGLKRVYQSVFKFLDVNYLGVYLGGEFHFYSKDKTIAKPEAPFIESLKEMLNKQDDYLYEATDLCTDEKRGTPIGSSGMAGIIVYRSAVINNLIVFLGAQEVQKEVVWGGKPKSVNIVLKNGERTLEPRGSFDLWREKVIGQSDDWTNDHRLNLKELMSLTERFILEQKDEKIKTTLHKSSYSDYLTELPNRRFLEKYINSITVESVIENDSITVFFIDLDNFKRVNDYLGHNAGDTLLKEVAQRLKQCVRPSDLVARLGGDEFVLVITQSMEKELDSEQTVNSIASKIICEVGRPIFYGEQAMITTPSIGAVICDPHSTSFEEILKRADIAMYRAKSMGKNRFHIFDNKDQKEVNFEVELEIDLRKALKNDDIQVYYQPKVNKKNEVVGAEALARWNHPKHGFISPEVFISLAEKNNLIEELGNNILRRACRQLSKWRQDYGSNAIKSLAVNVSPAQLLATGFESQVIEALQEYNLPSFSLCIEITESLFMENFEESRAVLRRLRKHGVIVSLDDFGTGYSSLSYLWKLPIDEVKIDRSFIANMTEDDDSLTMVEGMISLCKKLNMKIVAEGVEEKVQFTIVKGLGCDMFQGYFHGRPTPADQFAIAGSFESNSSGLSTG